jgi:prephenate dehydrogenase
MDIASLKEKEVAAMLTSTSADVVGCHPLFGPRVRSLKELNIILCPARGKVWLEWLTDLFKKKGATVTITTPTQHDEMMAVVQALNHFHTLTMGLALQGAGISLTELSAYMTPAFATKIGLIEKVCANPHLYAEIIIGNPHAKRLIDDYVKLVGKQGNIVAQNDGEKLAKLIQRCQASLADFL